MYDINYDIQSIDQWIYVNGNWGDIIVMLSQYYNKYQNKSFGVIINILPHEYLYKIIDFIQLQPNVLKILCFYSDYPWHMSSQITLDTLKKLSDYYHINFNKIDVSFSSPFVNKFYVYNNIPKYILPYESNIKKFGIDNLDQCILLHPFSFASCDLAQHWCGWIELLLYLIAKTKYTYILTGLNYNTSLFKQYSNVINLVNNNIIIKNNCDIFLLSNTVKYTITTSNSLSHWCTNQNNYCSIFSNNISTNVNLWNSSFGTKDKCKFYNYTTSVYVGLYNILKDMEHK